MTGQTTMAVKEIVITDMDFDRLNYLVDSARFRTSHPHFLSMLREELNRGKVVPGGHVPRNIVTMNTQVQVRDVKADETEVYTLTYPDEADIDAGKLSVLAPLGMALLGTKVGQTVKFDAPAGQRRLKIEKILYQPEAAGDYHL